MIIELLDFKQWKSVSNMASELPVTPATVAYHLRNMEKEEIVERNPKGNGWRFAPIHQTELTDYLKKKKTRKGK